ncbi:hypothetical protein [Arthrobacter sp. TMS1-12-1]
MTEDGAGPLADLLVRGLAVEQDFPRLPALSGEVEAVQRELGQRRHA